VAGGGSSARRVAAARLVAARRGGTASRVTHAVICGRAGLFLGEFAASRTYHVIINNQPTATATNRQQERHTRELLYWSIAPRPRTDVVAGTAPGRVLSSVISWHLRVRKNGFAMAWEG